MKTAATSPRRDQRPQSANRTDSLRWRSLQFLGLFVISLVAALTVLYLILHRMMDQPISPLDLWQSSFVWPMILPALMVAIGLDAVIRSVFPRKHQAPINGKAGPVPARPQQETRVRSDFARQVLHLTRNAERLDNVERDLIRRISDGFPVDLATQKLLREMRICTNRLRGQLSSLEQLGVGIDESETKHHKERRTVMAGIDPPELLIPKYETRQYRRR